MTNDKLKEAMGRAHISIDTISAETDVDPKTVQRWLKGRIPHARHRWKIAAILQELVSFQALQNILMMYGLQQYQSSKYIPSMKGFRYMARTDYYNDPNAPKANSLKPATSAVVTNAKGEILLQHRVDNQQWGLPGGGMEPGESIAQCVIREVKEETGLDVQPQYLIGLYSDPTRIVAYGNGEVRQQFSMCFYCTLLGGDIAVSDESTEVGFFTLADLAKLHLSPSIRQRIDHYLERREQPYFS